MNIVRRFLSIVVLLVLCRSELFAQAADSSSSSLKFSAYADVYYAQYSDSVAAGSFQKFPTISPRSNTFGVNTFLFTADYNSPELRATTTFQWGDIAECAWSPTFNNVVQAHVGARLFENLWFDVGLFRTHFGTESLYPKENICSSVSIPTYYEPFFESGARLQFTPSDAFSLSLYILNGYNTFIENNHSKSLGLLATYVLSDKGNIGYSNYIGDDTPDSDAISHLRYHNNVFWNYDFGKLKVQVGADCCFQRNSSLQPPTFQVKLNDSALTIIENPASKKTSYMLSAVLTVKYLLIVKTSVYARYEQLYDPDGIMSGVITQTNGTQSGYKVSGVTVGTEYTPTSKSYLRLEYRQLMMNNEQKIFIENSAPSSHRSEVLLNFGVSL